MTQAPSTMNLSPEQERAARHPGGPAIVLAGPGTGKTRTLVARHAHIAVGGSALSRIMVVTFNVRAAEELRTRIAAAHAGLGDKDAAKLFIGTFHSICARLLRRFAPSAGLRRDFEILDVQEQRQVIADLGIEWDSEDGDLTDIIGRWKDSMIPPDRAAAETAGSRTMSAAAAAYGAYEAEMRRRGCCDFADLILLAVKGMQSDPEFRGWVRGSFDHILVDEFQDVNKAQVEFLKEALGQARNIWAVGDDDQSLYGWRGSDVRYSVEFARHFPGASSYTLSSNYRCPPIVVAAADAVISKNKVRVHKSLVSARQPSPGDAVVIRSFDADRDEAAWIARQAAGMIGKGCPPSEIVVLFRTASVAASLQHAFEAAGVPFTLRGAQNFWSLPEVRAVVLGLRAVAFPNDRAVRESLGASRRGRALAGLAASMKGAGIRQCAQAVARIVGSNPPLGMSSERNGLWSDAADQTAQEALRFEEFEPFFAFADEMAERKFEERAEAVALSTIHSAKGLEWRHVFVAACEEQMMPHHKSEDVEEERRLLYVALTRAKTLACLTYSRSRFARGQSPSPFLFEMAQSVDRRHGEIHWPERPARQVRPEPEDRARERRAPSGGFSAKPQAAPSVRIGGLKTYRKKGGRSLIPPEDSV